MIQLDRMAQWLGSWATSYELPALANGLEWLWQGNEAALAVEEGKILKELSTWTGWSALSMATSLVGIFVGWRGLKAVANQERLLLLATCFSLTGIKWVCWKRRNLYWEKSEAAISRFPEKVVEMALSTTSQDPQIAVWLREQREILSGRIRVGGDNAQPLFNIQRAALRDAEGLSDPTTYLAQFTGLDANGILRNIRPTTAE